METVATEPKRTSEAPATSDDEPVNPPLTGPRFPLKPNPDHLYLWERGLSPETLKHFGLGHCNRAGMMQHRIAIPLHNERSELIGYLGRWASAELPDGVEKYMLPPKFRKNHMLFNLHRVADRGHVVVTEGCWSVFRLHELGIPAIALLGSTLSAEQIRLIRASSIRLVTVMLDGDGPGRKAQAEIVWMLARANLFVRSVELPEGTQPEA